MSISNNEIKNFNQNIISVIKLVIEAGHSTFLSSYDIKNENKIPDIIDNYLQLRQIKLDLESVECDHCKNLTNIIFEFMEKIKYNIINLYKIQIDQLINEVSQYKYEKVPTEDTVDLLDRFMIDLKEIYLKDYKINIYEYMSKKINYFGIIVNMIDKYEEREIKLRREKNKIISKRYYMIQELKTVLKNKLESK